jgi:type IV secretory pathway VirB6-like protein
MRMLRKVIRGVCDVLFMIALAPLFIMFTLFYIVEWAYTKDLTDKESWEMKL